MAKKEKEFCREDLCKHCWKNMTLRDYKGRAWGDYCLEAVQGALDGLFFGPTNDLSCFSPRVTKSLAREKTIARLLKLVKDEEL